MMPPVETGKVPAVTNGVTAGTSAHGVRTYTAKLFSDAKGTPTRRWRPCPATGHARRPGVELDGWF